MKTTNVDWAVIAALAAKMQAVGEDTSAKHTERVLAALTAAVGLAAFGLRTTDPQALNPVVLDIFRSFSDGLEKGGVPIHFTAKDAQSRRRAKH